MKYDEVMKELEALVTEQNRKIYKRHGSDESKSTTAIRIVIKTNTIPYIQRGRAHQKKADRNGDNVNK